MSSKRLLGFLKYCEKCAPNLPTFCPDMAARSSPLCEPCRFGRMVVTFLMKEARSRSYSITGAFKLQSVPYSLIGMVVAFVGFHGLQVGHVAEDEVLVGNAVAAE